MSDPMNEFYVKNDLMPSGRPNEYWFERRNPVSRLDIALLLKDKELLRGISSIFNKESFVFLIYADFCLHSKNFAPEFDKLADMITKEKEDNPNFPYQIGAINGDKYKGFEDENGFQTFPRIIILNNGIETEYKGNRTAGPLFAKMEKLFFGNLRHYAYDPIVNERLVKSKYDYQRYVK